MNENPSNDPAAPGGHQPKAGVDHLALDWAKRFLWCNPFYLASAALLLYGISRLTVAPDFPSEKAQLFFNFGALQIYEALLIVTAIALARRRVWYDATLLVFLENLFLFVPFILVSQAAYLGDEVTWHVCGSGALLAAGRFWSLRQFFPRLHLPNRLLALGAVMLLANIAMPVVFKQSHMAQDGSANGLSFQAWMWLMPVLAALANVLPRPTHWRGPEHERSWLPLGFFAIWVGVSCFHLYRLGYIYDLTWSPALAAPVAWAVAWTIYNRLNDFHPDPHPGLRQTCFCLPLGVSLLALMHEDSSIFFALSALNTLLYGAKYHRDRTLRLAFHLAMVSGTAMLAATPDPWAGQVLDEFARGKWVVLAICAHVVLRSLASGHPVPALLGAAAVAIATTILREHSPVLWFLSVQNGLVFLLLHSLRWDDRQHDGAKLLRIAAACVWVIDSFAWVHQAWPDLRHPLAVLGPETFFGGGLSVVSYAAVVLIGYGVAWIVRRHAGPLIIPISGFIVMATAPGRLLWDLLRDASVGLLALLGSLLLFGVGTLLAWMKHRWHQSDQPRTPA